MQTHNFKVGEDLFQLGLLDEAKNYFQEIIRTCPQNYEALNNLGTILYRQNNLPDAEKYYLESIALKDDDADTLSNLSDLYLHTKKWADAVSFLNRYLIQVPNDILKMNQLSLAYMESGQLQHAVSVLERSLEIKPDQNDIQDILQTLKKAPAIKTAPLSRRTLLVSIGLPVYNGGCLLSQAIESILAQDFDHYELIISDNCSNDHTQEVCLHYEHKDPRIHYHRSDENRGALTNFLNVLGISQAPFFMWASHDDLRENTFISACLSRIQNDPSVALVYPYTKVLDSESHFLHIAGDHFLVDQDSPLERFKNLIWGIGACNSFFGLFRSSFIKKVRSWGKSIFADNLALAEISLLGKIIQIKEPLFIRRLTRNYNYRSISERNAQLISDGIPELMNEGISFPHVRLAYGHVELVDHALTEDSDKEALINEISLCFKTRFGFQMKHEIDRAIGFINSGIIYRQWDEKEPIRPGFHEASALRDYHVMELVKRLQEAMFFYPESDELPEAYNKCFQFMRHRRRIQ